MNQNQTLCVVDMQDYFTSSTHCLHGVINEVRHAINTNTPIIIVEYINYDGTKVSDTHKPILDLLKDYCHVAFVEKKKDGGGYEIVDVAGKRKFSYDNIRMVGVNRSFCILETATELLDIQSTNSMVGVVEVVRGASWCAYPDAGLTRLKDVGVKLVNQRRKYND